MKVLGEGGLPSHDTRRWQSSPHLSHSLSKLREILDYLDRADIRMYRLPTALAPYASHPDLPQFHSQVEECEAELRAVGEIARVRGIRLSTHPGQYTVLNSLTAEVRDAAVAELEVQARLLDAMGLDDDAVVVLHVGGRTGGTEAALERFAAGFEQLSEPARRRLVVENDDRSFGLGDVLELARTLGVRVVWDVLHHRCYDPDGISDRQALSLAADTWKGRGVPKVHFSSPRLDVETRKVRANGRVAHRTILPALRAHADLIEPIAFEYFLAEVADRPFDVMLEAKAKDMALLRLRDQMAARGIATEAGCLVHPARR